MPLLILLLLFFALELGLFIEWGSQIGFLATLAIIVGSVILGVQIIRLTGFRLLQELQQIQQSGMMNRWWLQMRQQTMMRRMMAGLLLIVPGFATDILGLVFLVWSLFGTPGPKRREPEQPPQDPPASGRVIEGDYEPDPERSGRHDRTSGPDR